MVLSAVLKFAYFIISLFFTRLTSRNRYPILSQLIYDINIFDNNFNLLNMFLTNFNSSVEFAICSGIPSSEGAI